MHITSDADNRCTISYTDKYTGETIIRDFSAPIDGGLVVEEWTESRQAYYNLRRTGVKLVWRPHLIRTPRLADLICREYRGLRLAERIKEVRG